MRGLLTAAFTLLLSFAAILAYGGESGKFRKLVPETCFVVDKEAVAQLPPAWQKFSGFIRSCPLKERAEKAAKVSIIAIWVENYYAARPPEAIREEFPKPIIVGQDHRTMGSLPELYPIDEPREADLYYGKWVNGIPQELRMDVSNPAVSGDYHYPPIRFTDASGNYEMKDHWIIYGRRRSK